MCPPSKNIVLRHCIENLVLLYANGSCDSFFTDVIPWAQTADATVNPCIKSKCEYYQELVVEASKHRDLHTRLAGGRHCIVYPNTAEKLKSKLFRDRYALIFIYQLLNECTM